MEMSILLKLDPRIKENGRHLEEAATHINERRVLLIS